MAQFCLYDVDEDNNLSILEFSDKVGQVSTIYSQLSIGHKYKVGSPECQKSLWGQAAPFDWTRFN